MASVVGQAIIQVRPNLAPFKREVEAGTSAVKAKPVKVDADTKGFTSKLKGLTPAIAALGAALGAAKGVEFLKGSIDAASDLNESLSKTRVVFGSSSAAVEKFAADAASSMGQSRQAALESTATFGNLFTAMKLGKPQAASMSTSVVKLAGDLASFNNVRPEEAIEALRSGLVGEVEPLRRFGVNVSAAALQQKAFALGLIKTEKEALTPAAKAQAAYALIMEQTKTAQGDFARTSTGLANQQRILSARFTDLKARIGSALLPVVLKVVGALNDLIGVLMTRGPGAIATVKAKFAELSATLAPFVQQAQEIGRQVIAWLPSFAQVVSFLDRFKVAIAAAVGAFAAFRAAVGIVNAVRNSIAALNLVLAANPIVLVGLAIAALAAAFVIAYQRSETFRNIVQQALTTVQTIAQTLVTWVTGTLVPALTGAFNAVATTWSQNSARIQANVMKFLSVLQTVWGWIRGPALTIVRATFTAIATIIRAQITIVQNVIQLVLNVLAGRWGAAFGNLKTIARTALTAAVSVIQGLGGAFLSAAGQIAAKVLSGIRTGLSKLPGLFRQAMGALPGLLAEAARGAESMALGIGSAIIRGILNGVGGLASALKNKVSGLIGSALSHIDIPGGSPPEHAAMTFVGEPLVQGILKPMNSLSPRLAKAMSSAVKDAIVQAKSSLTGIAGSLSGSINSVLDARLAASPASQALRDAQAQQAALDFQRQKAQLEATIADTNTSDDDRQKAQADLAVLLAQQAADAEAAKVNAAKAANDRQLADLSTALNKGLITQAEYQKRVIALLKDQGVDYKAAGDLLGLAFAEGFQAQLKGLLDQARAVARSGRPDLNELAPDITNPASVLRAEVRDAQKQLKQMKADARAKDSQGGRKVTAAEQRKIDAETRQVRALEALAKAFEGFRVDPTPVDVTVTATPDSWLQVAGDETGDAGR